MSTSGKYPALSDSEIERYARQIVIPGVGAEGQARLCASRVRVVGETTAVELAVSYLKAGGVRAAAGLPVGDTELMLIAGADVLPRRQLERVTSSNLPVLWYCVHGTAVRSGSGAQDLAAALVPTPNTSPALSREPALVEALHAVAACDLAASAMRMLLGWPEQSISPEVTLA